MNICINCKKAIGKCSWSAIDPVTNEPLFQPIEGWTATKTSIGSTLGSRIWTYDITDCPEFELDTRVAEKVRRYRCKWCGNQIEVGSDRISFCESCVPPGPDYQKTINRMLAIIKRGAPHSLEEYEKKDGENNG